MSKIPKAQAKKLGDQLGVDWSEVDLREFTMGINTELEHKSTIRKLAGPGVDLLKASASIALDHLDEFPDYYSKLKVMEGG